MKFVRNLLLLSIICLFYAPIALAQNGAVVVRDEVVFAWGWKDNDLIALGATDMDNFCAPEAELDEFPDTMTVTRPDGSVKHKEGGALYTRLFFSETWGPFFDDPCAFWNNSDILVAEGIANYSSNDNDRDGDTQHPNRRNVWGLTLSGTLYTPYCQSGMIDLSIIEQWMLAKDKSGIDKYKFKFNVDCTE
jgi:hypothetical protein